MKSFLNLYPQAPLFTIVFDPLVAKEHFPRNKIHSTLIQNLPQAVKSYKKYMPLMPFAMEQIDLTGYQIILSSSHAFAKGVLTRGDQMHICYCHTPIRYAWDLYHQYMEEAGLTKGVKSQIARLIMHYIRMWDFSTAGRVDYFIANSRYVADRIFKIYGRKADVIHPPVDTKSFSLSGEKDNYFLVVSRLVPYKKIDIIVQAFSKLDYPLLVVGDGSELNNIKQNATTNIEFLGWQSSDRVIDLMKKARALIFAADEDFGIVPVEAQSCGTPVIAYGKGGALETVNPLLTRYGKKYDGEGYIPTGVFFGEQTPLSIINAVKEFTRYESCFNPAGLREHAEKFSTERFEAEISSYVAEKWEDFSSTRKTW